MSVLQRNTTNCCIINAQTQLLLTLIVETQLTSINKSLHCASADLNNSQRQTVTKTVTFQRFVSSNDRNRTLKESSVIPLHHYFCQIGETCTVCKTSPGSHSSSVLCYEFHSHPSCRYRGSKAIFRFQQIHLKYLICLQISFNYQVKATAMLASFILSFGPFNKIVFFF